ncbi:signal peptidase I [bacterium F11]|nr:signal peptidase I [bacterium F11]
MLFGAGLGYWRGRDKERREKLLHDNLEWADTGFSAILLASLVMFFIIQAFKIPSGSMRMTFVEGDHLFVNKFIYGVPVPFTNKKFFKFKKVKSGEIVIFRFPSKDKTNPHYGKDFIKRVVAVEGQIVEIKNKVLIVDGVEQEEPFKQHKDSRIYNPSFKLDPKDFQERWETANFSSMGGNDIRDNFGPVVIPSGRIMVMGDNRDRSFDSRYWGPLPLSAIKGKALLLYWPLRRFRMIH